MATVRYNASSAPDGFRLCLTPMAIVFTFQTRANFVLLFDSRLYVMRKEIPTR
jgi:hypothetical protein